MNIVRKAKINHNNSLTMQKALETAYDDWNKNKTDSSSTNDDQEVVETSHTKSEILNEENETQHVQADTTITQTTPEASTISVASTTPISYYFGNPLVDLVKGIMHIYKDK